MGRMTMGMVLAVILASCASSGPPTREFQAEELLRLAGSLERNPPRDGSETFVVDTLDVSPQRAFMAVRAAYEDIGIPFSFYEAEQLRLGGFIRELGELDGEQPSTWIDCGRGAGVAEYADTYEVSMAVGTRVLALDRGGSVVETVIRARARARDVSSGLLRCRSFGTFEDMVLERVRTRAGR